MISSWIKFLMSSVTAFSDYRLLITNESTLFLFPGLEILIFVGTCPDKPKRQRKILSWNVPGDLLDDIARRRNEHDRRISGDLPTRCELPFGDGLPANGMHGIGFGIELHCREV